MLHASKPGILSNPLLLIQPVGHLNSKLPNIMIVPRYTGNLTNNDRLLGKLLVHRLDERNRLVALVPIVVQTQVVRRVVLDTVHKVRDPLLSSLVVGAAGADELLALVLAQREHLLVPQVCGVLCGDSRALRLVEVVDHCLVAVLDVFPVVAAELFFQSDHGSEGGSVVELGWVPGVPV